jgi:hypothetical protein
MLEGLGVSSVVRLPRRVGHGQPGLLAVRHGGFGQKYIANSASGSFMTARPAAGPVIIAP